MDFSKFRAFGVGNPTFAITIAYFYLCASGMVYTSVLGEKLGITIPFFYGLQDYILSALHRPFILFFASISLLIMIGMVIANRVSFYFYIIFIFPIAVSMISALKDANTIKNCAQNTVCCKEWTVYMNNGQNKKYLVGVEITDKYYIGAKYQHSDKKDVSMMVIPKSNVDRLVIKKCPKKCKPAKSAQSPQTQVWAS